MIATGSMGGVGGFAAVRPCFRLLASQIFPKRPHQLHQTHPLLLPICPYRHLHLQRHRRFLFSKCSAGSLDVASLRRAPATRPSWVATAIAPPMEAAAPAASVTFDVCRFSTSVEQLPRGGADKGFERIFVHGLTGDVKPLVFDRMELDALSAASPAKVEVAEKGAVAKDTEESEAEKEARGG